MKRARRAFGRFRTGGVILIALLMAGAMEAQDGLRFDGQVVDGATRLPVPGAEIELDGQPADGEAEFTMRADTFGFFAISDVPEGAYELRVVAPGFQPYEEAVTLSPEVKANRRIELTSVVGHVTFDVVFEVFDLATHVRLADAQITASYWNPDGDLSGGADQVIQAQTDVSGTAEIRGLSDGFYRFRITRPGWEPLDYEPSSDAGVVVGDKVRLVRSQLGAVYMKSIRTDLKVTVEGFDPVLNEAGQPLQEVTLQLTGYDFTFDRETLPTESAMTGEDGAYTFTDLAPVNYVLSIGRLGYTAKEIQIEAGPDGTFTEVNETLELEPTELKVVLESPYKTVDAVKNAKIILRGILDSHSEGIERELTSEIEAGDEERVSALFENLLPGRYWLHTVHEATISGFPTSSGPLPGAQSFRVSFFPRESYAELIPGQMEELVIAMEPVPAIVRGRLWATDEVGFLEEDPCFSEPYRVFYQVAQDGIEFIEHGIVDLLKEPHGMVVVNTDASGSYTALLTPGVFGVKIPGMAGYAGHNVECGELSAGLPPQPGPWPYPDPWPHSTLEFGHHRAGLGFNSDGEYQLDLFVHKHYINISGRVRTTGAPFGDLVLRMKADGTDVLRFPYNHLWDTGTEVVLSGPVELRAALDQNNRYMIQNVPAGSYTLQLDHADYVTPAVEVTIADWQAPGVIPAVAPFTPSYFFPGIVHCDARFDLEAAWRLQDSVRIDLYRYSASEMDYFSEGSGPPGYFRMPGLEDRLFTYSGQGLPTGVYRIWLRYGDGWYSEAGLGPLFEAFLGGPFNNVSGEAGAAPIGDFAYKLDLRAVSAAEPSRAVPGTMVEFSGGLMRQANTGQELDHAVSPYPTGASAGPEWSMSAFPGSKVELIDAATRRVKVTVYMNRNMVVSGTVKTAAGDPIPGAAVVFRNRCGSPAGQTVTSAQGAFQRTFTSPQAIYLDINRRGFIPQRHRLEPQSLDNPDVTGLEYEMASVPGPQIERFTMNRFGLFLPGVTRSGDSNIPILGGGSGFNPEAGRKKLTVTWEAEATPQSYSFELPGFVNQNEQQKTPEQFDVDDELAEVWIVDRRSFEAPFVNDPGQEDFLPVDPPFPLDYVTVRNWLSEITSAERNGRPYYVVHKVVLKNAPGSGNDVKETLNLWELPSGVFNPRVVAITKNGGVAVKDYELPETGGDTPPHHLQGMNLPRWLSSVLEVVGTMAVLPKAEIDLVNKNYGDNYLKIGSVTPKVEARIGVVPIEESSVIYDPAENLLESDLYLTYKYVVGVEMPLGEKTPAGGPLALAPKILGVKIDGLDAEFEVSGNERKACVAVVVPAPSEVTTEELNRKYEPVMAEDSGRRGGRVKFKEPQFSASAKLAACETLDATALGKNRISSYRLILEAQGTGEFGVSVDLTPVIQALPYVGKPLHEINEAAGRLRRDGTKPVTLSAIFEALLGAKYTVEIIGDFPAPPTGSVVSGDTFPRWNFMGGQEVQGPGFDIEEAKKIILRLGVGLDLQAAYGAIQGTGLVQLGAPKGASDTDGVFFTLNPTDTSPLIKKIEGAVSFVLRAKLNLYVTKISKQWQHDFIVFVLDRSSEPSFTLTPLFITTTVIDAAGAPPYV
ncbi:MAG TPA: carboxypeptidase-like regulatory domain-containing protein, partial [Methylomirabilota bacterium]|nr:carboxypeptidase-like regulatory domain-containing protein [Methylomirabilota bacterium]